MNELVEFILDARKAGESNDEIIESLVSRGWQNEQIVAAFTEADQQVAVVPPQEMPAPETPIIQEQAQLSEPVQPETPSISSFAVPSEVYIPQGFTQEPQLPPIPVEDPKPMPMYVNETALKEPKKSNSKAMIVMGCILLVFLGGGFAAWKGLLPLGMFQKTQRASAAFADYEPLKKDSAILLNDSVSFTITGFQVMSSDDFNALQADSNSTLPAENQALLVYYTLQNMSDSVQTISTGEGDTQAFSIVDGKHKRVDVSSPALTESLFNLSELKSKQYTSNALIFVLPKSITNTHDLYLVLQSPDAKPPKGFIQL